MSQKQPPYNNNMMTQNYYPQSHQAGAPPYGAPTQHQPYGYGAPPQHAQNGSNWAVAQPHPQPHGGSNIVIVTGQSQPPIPALDPEELSRQNCCRTCAMCMSISSLLLTWCCWFSGPAICLACKNPAPGSMSSYKCSIGLSSVAFILTLAWVIVVIVYVTILVQSSMALMGAFLG